MKRFYTTLITVLLLCMVGNTMKAATAANCNNFTVTTTEPIDYHIHKAGPANANSLENTPYEETLTPSTEVGYDELTVVKPGTSGTGSELEIQKGDIVVCSDRGYIKDHEMTVYKGGTMTIGFKDGIDAYITKVELVVRNYHFAKPSGWAAEYSNDLTTIIFEDVEETFTTTATNKSSITLFDDKSGKVTVKQIIVSYRMDGSASITNNTYLSLPAINIKPGETKEVSMLLTNDKEVKAVQGNIKLPSGLSFVTKSNGRLDVSNVNSRSEDFTLSCALQDDGSMTFAHYSADGFAYDGNEGGIFTFKIKADENAAPGSYEVKLSEMVLSIEGVAYEEADRTCPLNITSTNGISEITIDDSSQVYTLDGLKVSGKPKMKGIYIVNGRKVIVK